MYDMDGTWVLESILILMYSVASTLALLSDLFPGSSIDSRFEALASTYLRWCKSEWGNRVSELYCQRKHVAEKHGRAATGVNYDKLFGRLEQCKGFA